jgi:hypothetical protein
MLSLLSVFITERYRLAAVPGLLLFAAFTVTQLWRACATGTLIRAAAITALLAASTWFVSVRRGNPELWALDAYNSGVQALADNDLGAAEKRLTLAQAYVPNNAEVNFALGNLEMARGNRSAAQASYMRTLSLNPQHKGVFNNLGVPGARRAALGHRARGSQEGAGTGARERQDSLPSGKGAARRGRCERRPQRGGASLGARPESPRIPRTGSRNPCPVTTPPRCDNRRRASRLSECRRR